MRGKTMTEMLHTTHCKGFSSFGQKFHKNNNEQNSINQELITWGCDIMAPSCAHCQPWDPGEWWTIPAEAASLYLRLQALQSLEWPRKHMLARNRHGYPSGIDASQLFDWITPCQIQDSRHVRNCGKTRQER